MNRRQYLASAVGVASLSGCVSSGSEQADRGQNDASPSVETVSILSDWHEQGDMSDNQIETIIPTDPAIVGLEVDLVCSDEREMRWRRTTLIRNNSGEVVSDHTDTFEDFSNDCEGGVTTWEQSIWMYYKGDGGLEWQTGEYTAEVTIDDYYGEASVSGSTTFEVVES